MQTTSKSSLIVLTLSVIATCAALADDPQLQNRLVLQRQASPSKTTIAVYAAKCGAGNANCAVLAERVEWRANPHGQVYSVRVRGK